DRVGRRAEPQVVRRDREAHGAPARIPRVASKSADEGTITILDGRDGAEAVSGRARDVAHEPRPVVVAEDFRDPGEIDRALERDPGVLVVADRHRDAAALDADVEVGEAEDLP